ncbi:MAG: penicillin-binding protein 2 [Paludibacteraceae bacterium]|nr:penicillin-binding protein 2 [Paludibacteraceae bacterium]
MIIDKFYKRRYVIGGLAVLVVTIFVIRLFILQIIDQSTKSQADSNALVKQTIHPARGLIYDRNGQLLVFNQPIYEIQVILHEMGQDFDTLAFCQSINISRSTFDERMSQIKDRKRNPGFSKFSQQTFLGQMSKEQVASLQQSLYRFSGVYISKRTLRDYTYDAACHVLGSIGEVNQKDLERDTYFSIGDYSGRDGIEKTYEQQLRGEKGVEILMRDSRGRLQGAYLEGTMDQRSIAGQDLTLTLDIKLQLLAEKLLQGKVGSVVAIEPATGEILALASSPNWNPKQLVGRERSEHYSQLLNDSTKPLLNRATQALYPPGSTFKTVQALVCLQEQGIKLTTEYPCFGPISNAGQPIKCTHNHGTPNNLTTALEQSCNPYFWCAFRDMLQRDGYGKDNEDFKLRYDLWRKDVLSFGLGARFEDTDVSEQAVGYIPDRAFYDRMFGPKGWKAITIRSLSIGQGEILVTPLQLANQAAAIANKGYYITPHLNKSETAVHKHVTAIDSSYFDIVHEGMHAVMINGTGRWYNIDSLGMCGKTGTAQNPHGDDHAIFMGFAPMNNPKIAVAVVVENAGYGATWAAPIASLMMEQACNDTIKRKYILDRIANATINPNVQRR